MMHYILSLACYEALTLRKISMVGRFKVGKIPYSCLMNLTYFSFAETLVLTEASESIYPWPPPTLQLLPRLP